MAESIVYRVEDENTIEGSQVDNKEKYDLFIAYHGNEQSGSLLEAKEVYQKLNGYDLGNGRKLRVFLQVKSNDSGAFSHTPIIVRNCRKLLLVADSRIPVNKRGYVQELDESARLKWLYEELRAFQKSSYYLNDTKNSARVLYYPDLIRQDASRLHAIFNGKKNFDGIKERERNYQNLIKWACEGCDDLPMPVVEQRPKKKPSNDPWAYDLCIVYQDNGRDALNAAMEIYDSLNERDMGKGEKLRVFLQPAAPDGSGFFGRTSIIVKTCRKLLLVADKNVAVTKDGLLAEYNRANMLTRCFESVDKFANGPYRWDHKGSARVFCLPGLTPNAAEILHPVFDGKAHFNGVQEKNDNYENVFKWACTKRIGDESDGGKVDVNDNKDKSGNKSSFDYSNNPQRKAKAIINTIVGAALIIAVIFGALWLSGTLNKDNGNGNLHGTQYVTLDTGVVSDLIELQAGQSVEISFTSSGRTLTDLIFEIDYGTIDAIISWINYDSYNGRQVGEMGMHDIETRGIWCHFIEGGQDFNYTVLVTAVLGGASFRALKNEAACDSISAEETLTVSGKMGDVFAWDIELNNDSNQSYTHDENAGAMLFAYNDGFTKVSADIDALNDYISALGTGRHQIGIILLEDISDPVTLRPTA